MTTELLRTANRRAVRGEVSASREEYQNLLAGTADSRQRAVLLNNLAALEAAEGRYHEAGVLFGEARTLGSASAQRNLQLMEQRIWKEKGVLLAGGRQSRIKLPIADGRNSSSQRIAIVSFLFNWPSTGGGTVHTKELGDFLTRAGYAVQHLFVRYDPWQIGQVNEPLPYDHQPLEFSERDWSPDIVRDGVRAALRDFGPDQVILTDSWNSKVLLAEAAAEFPYFMRLAAQEGICPLNNLRLVVDPHSCRQCDRVQLAKPHECRECVQQNGDRMSGPLHQAEREFSGYFDADYPDRLRRTYRNAEAVLAVNPFIADLARPHVQRVEVIPSGFDPERFPRPEWLDATSPPALRAPPTLPPTPSLGREGERLCRILFAGIVEEFMKGFHVLQQAAVLLWDQRQNFELVVTSEPVGSPHPFARYVGWQSQETLPDLMRTCDVLAFPTIAQEALGRTAVEAMGCGLPVVASRIGGLPWVVEENRTGLLCIPGDPHDLAQQLSRLIDNPALRQQLGRSGREKFEREFTWERILPRYAALVGMAKG